MVSLNTTDSLSLETQISCLGQIAFVLLILTLNAEFGPLASPASIVPKHIIFFATTWPIKEDMSSSTSSLGLLIRLMPRGSIRLKTRISLSTPFTLPSNHPRSPKIEKHTHAPLRPNTKMHPTPTRLMQHFLPQRIIHQDFQAW